MYTSHDYKQYFCPLLLTTVKTLEITALTSMPVILVVLEVAAPDACYEPISCLQEGDIKVI